jgi:hypothetical protein
MADLGWPTPVSSQQGLSFARYGKRAQFSVGFIPMAIPDVPADQVIRGDTAYEVTYTVYACFWKYLVPGFTNDGQPVC